MTDDAREVIDVAPAATDGDPWRKCEGVAVTGAVQVAVG